MTIAVSPIAVSTVLPAATGALTQTTHNVPFPASVPAGATLLIFGRCTVAGAISLPAGWVVAQDSSDAADDVSFWAYRNTAAAGTEGGTTVTVTHGSGKLAAMSIVALDAADPATTPPQGSTVAIGTGVAANATIVTPTGGAKEYLWLTASMIDGEQTLTPTVPANYVMVDVAETQIAGAVTTNCRVAVARRSANAASEDSGAWSWSVAGTGWTAWTVAIHPGSALAADETVLDDFNRADGQLNAGAGAALWTQTYYNSSDPTDMQVKGNQLADGTSTWQNANSIFQLQTDFDMLIDCVVAPVAPNLEFGWQFCVTGVGTTTRNGYGVFWGSGNWFLRRYDSGVNAGNLATGATALLAGDTLWIRKRGSDIRLYRKPSGGSYSLVMRAVDATYGQGVIVVELSDLSQRWDNLRGGPLVVVGPVTRYGATASNYTFVKAVQAVKKTFGQVDRPVTFTKAVQGVRKGFGQVAAPFTFGKAVQGVRKTFGQVAAPFLLSVSVAGKTSGPAIPIPPGSERMLDNTPPTTPVAWHGDYTNGSRFLVSANGTISHVIYYVPEAGPAHTCSIWDTNSEAKLATVIDSPPAAAGWREVALPTPLAVFAGVNYTVTASVDGSNFSQSAPEPTSLSPHMTGPQGYWGYGTDLFPTNDAGDAHYLIDVAYQVGVTTAYGRVDAPLTFARVVAARRQTFGVVARPVAATIAVQGSRKTFGQIALPVTFTKDVQGRRKTFGSLAAPFVFTKAVQGQRRVTGQIAAPFTFTKAVQAQRKTFGQVALPITALVYVGSRATYRGALALPLTFTATSTGNLRRTSVGLADRIYLGGVQVDRIYVGTTEVWEKV